MDDITTLLMKLQMMQQNPQMIDQLAGELATRIPAPQPGAFNTAISQLMSQQQAPMTPDQLSQAPIAQGYASQPAGPATTSIMPQENPEDQQAKMQKMMLMAQALQPQKPLETPQYFRPPVTGAARPAQGLQQQQASPERLVGLAQLLGGR